MAYVKQEPTVWVPGLAGSANAVGNLLVNATEIGAIYAPPILIDPRFYAETTSPSDILIARFAWPRNADLSDIVVQVRCKTTSGTLTATAELRDGTNADTQTTTTTSSSYTWKTLVLSPSTVTPSTHPKHVYLYLRTTAGTASISGIVARFAPSYPPGSGVRASGFCETNWWDRDATVDPLPSAVMEQVLRNPRAIARDRPAGLFGVVQDQPHAFSRYMTSSLHPKVVERFILPFSDPGRRLYRVSAMTSAPGGGSAYVELQIGGYTWDVAPGAWMHEVVELSIPPMTRCTARLHSSNGSMVYLDSLQILREPG